MPDPSRRSSPPRGVRTGVSVARARALPARARRRADGPVLGALLALGIVLIGGAPQGRAAESALDRFLRRSVSELPGARDSLATGFAPAQLPLLAHALAHRDDLDPARRQAAYEALVRWHFWTGTHWDPDNRGLWGAAMSPELAGSLGEHGVCAAGAALELVQLSALAHLAAAGEHYYDALVWWSDHAALRRRLEDTLLDPATGAWSDLDSLGRRHPPTGPGALLPLAFGARTLPSAARTTAWEVWSGDPSPGAADTGAARAHAMEVADALHGWAREPSLRLFAPPITAALVRRSTRAILDTRLELLVRDALGSVGLAVSDSLRLRLGTWTPSVSLDDLDPPTLARSWAALGFLHGAGVLADGEAEALRRELAASAGDDTRLPQAVSELTEHLVRWRTQGFGDPPRVWEERRKVRGQGPNGPDGVLRLQNEEIARWAERALDRIAEDLIDHALRNHLDSGLRGRLDPEVAGRRDDVRLCLQVVRPGPSLPDSLTVLWTDGRRVLPPTRHALVTDGDGDACAWVGEAPDRTGLWSLIAEGEGAQLRQAPRLLVVEPVALDLDAQRLDRARLQLVVDVANQIGRPVEGRLDLQLPLNWDVSPSSRLDFALGARQTQTTTFELRAEGESSPGLYPVRFELFALGRPVETRQAFFAVPFQWLKLGPLSALGEDPLHASHPPDRGVDLAERTRSAGRTVGWARLADERSRADGWVELAGPEPQPAVHYAFTALVTSTREGSAVLEAEGPAQLRVNGVTVAETSRWGGRDQGDLRMGPGTNYVLVKTVSRPGRITRFRVELRDIDGEPLHGVDNALESLLDQYAYLTRDPDAARTTSQRETLRLVPITYVNRAARSVSVVGSFNGWSPTATPMTPLGDGRWQAKVRLRPGRFEYKLAVDGRWIADPANPDAVDDGFGGRNSVLVVE